ncbi:hypothetical protein NPS01_01500 [Nocardioides psychrotolerans]|uniref:Uncharacterized protein n=1 Tax=Nocardioides psychrotolerans TaxID=1005945 RepID=A0A1I3BS24_9ACTN|nr:hypothetical protein [Nocardioides psychrotolerans]GEP36487.1 hypothetical protein NPS01_01500 [Nocardioides psychrotolerans]SFH64886.1 hypothetical protein SAMN05216561_101290 [Nocardioides psychrotolerans]
MTSTTAAALGLLPPREGEAERAHDATLEAWDIGLSALRDVVNLGIRAINQAGAGLSELPDGSLEELLVVPLSGDWEAIGQNAVACHQVEDALSTWSRRVLGLGVHAALVWRGAAASAYVVRVEGLALAGLALAVTVGRAALLLDEVADFCERLAVRVERLLVDLGETLARLARRILTRIAGPLGWAVFAADIATSGMGAVSDIIDDVRRVADTIDTLTALQHEVSSWAQVQAARLESFGGLPDLVPTTL